jgi:inorganic phosphate transporter, PiT family
MHLLAALFLGWSLGANGSATCFGTAVSSGMVRWRTAAILIAMFVLLGALLEGEAGLHTLGALSRQDLHTAFCITLAAAITVAAMTALGLPVSISQIVVGAILGAGVARGTAHGSALGTINLAGLKTIVLCWLGTPVVAAVLAMLLYPLLARLVRSSRLHFITYDALMRALLVAAGIYSAYAFGANNVANITGVLHEAGAFGGGTRATWLALALGGIAIGGGALTYSRKVMMTVGSGILPLDAFSAFVVVLAEAATVHLYARLGVPVSLTQATVGAVFGIGLLHGLRTVSGSTLLWILAGWLLTPVAGGVVAFVFAAVL